MAQPMPLDCPVIILAGGLGTRLRAAVADRPKVLAPVGGRPFLTYLFDQLETAGFQNVILCTGHLSDQIQRAFGSSYRSLSLAYSVENEPLGTAGALRLALSQTAGGLCLAMNGDSYIDADLGAFLDWHRVCGRAGSLLLTRVEDAARYGTVEVSEDGAILAFREKQGQAVPGWISAGIYLLARHLLESIPTDRAVSIERECFPRWTQSGLGGFRIEGEFIDIGTPESLARAEDFFAGIQHDRQTQR